MNILRTPEECFRDLAEYPFEPRYLEVAAGALEVAAGGDGIASGVAPGLRIHYLDEGPRDGEIVLCMHGQPTWSYLYRHMIPRFTSAGYRVIAPDLVGFGRSDKPDAPSDYTYARHVQWMSDWFTGLGLDAVTLVCQDWGGLIGLRLVAAFPERFARVVVANTGLPDAQGLPAEMAGPMRALLASIEVPATAELGARFREPGPAPGFFYWIRYAAEQPDFRVSDLMQVTAMHPLTPAQRAAYDAPFPDDRYMAGARRFPSLVPIFPDDPELPAQRAAWAVLRSFDRPFLTAFGDSDPVTAGQHLRFQQEVPGARGQNHLTIANAGHFLQEDQPAAFANAIIAFMQANPLGR